MWHQTKLSSQLSITKLDPTNTRVNCAVSPCKQRPGLVSPDISRPRSHGLACSRGRSLCSTTRVRQTPGVLSPPVNHAFC
ncbi:hypothetical protein M3J09_010794 [Ascochyta lentis]